MGRRQAPSLLVWMIFLIHFPVYSKYPSYKQMDPVFEKTWMETFPLPYKRIVAKNPNQTGVLYYQSGKEEYYIYTYSVAMGIWVWNEESPEETSEERIITVLLFYEPRNQENPYSLRIGDITVQDLNPRWIRTLRSP